MQLIAPLLTNFPTKSRRILNFLICAVGFSKGSNKKAPRRPGGFYCLIIFLLKNYKVPPDLPF